MRSAIWIWVAGTAIFYAFGIALPSDLLGAVNALVAGVIFGFFYGAITGMALTFILWRQSRRQPSAA